MSRVGIGGRSKISWIDQSHAGNLTQSSSSRSKSTLFSFVCHTRGDSESVSLVGCATRVPREMSRAPDETHADAPALAPVPCQETTSCHPLDGLQRWTEHHSKEFAYCFLDDTTRFEKTRLDASELSRGVALTRDAIVNLLKRNHVTPSGWTRDVRRDGTANDDEPWGNAEAPRGFEEKSHTKEKFVFLLYVLGHSQIQAHFYRPWWSALRP